MLKQKKIKEFSSDALKEIVSIKNSFSSINLHENGEIENGIINKSIHIEIRILEFKLTKIFFYSCM
jgi:hypothetical protein